MGPRVIFLFARVRVKKSATIVFGCTGLLIWRVVDVGEYIW